MKKILKIALGILLWVIITAILPPIGFILLLIGLPLWVLISLLKKQNPTLFVPQDHGRIIKTVVLNTKSSTKTSSTIGRAAVGDVVAGAPGAIIGAMTGKKKTSTRFLVIYEDGLRDTIDVPDGSLQYNEFIKYLAV